MFFVVYGIQCVPIELKQSKAKLSAAHTRNEWNMSMYARAHVFVHGISFMCIWMCMRRWVCVCWARFIRTGDMCVVLLFFVMNENTFRMVRRWLVTYMYKPFLQRKPTSSNIQNVESNKTLYVSVMSMSECIRPQLRPYNVECVVACFNQVKSMHSIVVSGLTIRSWFGLVVSVSVKQTSEEASGRPTVGTSSDSSLTDRDARSVFGGQSKTDRE